MLNREDTYDAKMGKKIFHKKPGPCEGCDMAMLTS